jgi:hypothetical protein
MKTKRRKNIFGKSENMFISMFGRLGVALSSRSTIPAKVEDIKEKH